MTSTKICSLCKEQKLVSNFNKCKITKSGLQSRCRDCEKKRSKKYYRQNRIKALKTSHKRRLLYVQRDREFVLAYLRSHSCIDCGEADPIVLEFDHVRGKKINSISYMVSRGISINKIETEIAKCEVRCANCHRRKTAKDFSYFKSLGLNN